MDPVIFSKLSAVVGLLVSGFLKVNPKIGGWFAALDRRKKIYALVGVSVLYGAAALLGDPSADAIFDALLSLGGMLGGAATGYVMWRGQSQG